MGFTAANIRTKDCFILYSTLIDNFKYVHKQNIAIIVQAVDKIYVSARRSESNSTYQSYWLNPQFMAARMDGT